MTLKQLRHALAHGAQVWGYDVDEEQELPRRWLVAHMDPMDPIGLAYTEPVQARTLLAAIRRGYLTWYDVPGL